MEILKFSDNTYKKTNIQLPSTMKDVMKMKWFNLDKMYTMADPSMYWPISANVSFFFRPNPFNNSDLSLFLGKIQMQKFLSRFIYNTTTYIRNGL